MRLFAYSLSACLITTSSVFAHPGHGVTEGDSVIHYLLEPLHIGPVLLLTGAIALAIRWQKTRKNALQRVRALKPRSGK